MSRRRTLVAALSRPRLAALVPQPRVNLTRYHGVLAPNSSLRAQVTPAVRGGRAGRDALKSTAERQAARPKAQRLRRVFRIDIETCEHCGGAVKVIASIEDPVVIQRILDHLERRSTTAQASPHAARAPPQGASPGLTE